LYLQLVAPQRIKQEFESKPYVAAKFPQRNIPYTFHLGNGEAYDGYINRKLQRGRKYRIFVRSVVDTPQKVSLVIELCENPITVNFNPINFVKR
jgi:hypothetical protein